MMDVGGEHVTALYEDIFKVLGDEPAPCSMSPDSWFGEGNASDWVKALCAACPAETQCNLYAATAGESYGMWGGQGTSQRKKLGLVVKTGKRRSKYE